MQWMQWVRLVAGLYSSWGVDMMDKILVLLGSLILFGWRYYIYFLNDDHSVSNLDVMIKRLNVNINFIRIIHVIHVLLIIILWSCLMFKIGLILTTHRFLCTLSLNISVNLYIFVQVKIYVMWHLYFYSTFIKFSKLFKWYQLYTSNEPYNHYVILIVYLDDYSITLVFIVIHET